MCIVNSFDVILMQDLLRKLLVLDRTKRLGCMHSGAQDIKNHDWFKSIDWAKAEAGELKPSFVPSVIELKLSLLYLFTY